MFARHVSLSAARGQVHKAFPRAASTVSESFAQRPMSNLAKVLLGGAAASFFSATVALASGGGEDQAAPPHYRWPHEGLLESYDTASLRRGFEVYRQVCATCHSMRYLAYRNLVGVTHTEAQAKAVAASVKVMDGPNENGEMYERPGRLTDRFVSPYANEELARSINNGALPPDLSLIVKARPGHEDYIFALLTGYRDPPHGVKLRPGLNYNPYFGGGAIGMAKQLTDGQMEYEDGTPATESQMAKDVTCFLTWAAEPFQDERKRAGFKWLTAMAVMWAITGYHKRLKWNTLKTRRIEYRS